MENNKKLPTGVQKGKISYNNSIVSAIVAIAVSQINGVHLHSKSEKNSRRDGIKVDIEKEGVYVDVSVLLDYGYNVPDVAYLIQETIRHNVESMSEFKIANVDVHIRSVIFPEETAPAAQQ